MCDVSAGLGTGFVSGKDNEGGLRRIRASRLRFNLQPLMTQRDYVNSYYYVKLVTDQVYSAVGRFSEIVWRTKSMRRGLGYALVLGRLRSDR